MDLGLGEFSGHSPMIKATGAHVCALKHTRFAEGIYSFSSRAATIDTSRVLVCTGIVGRTPGRTPRSVHLVRAGRPGPAHRPTISASCNPQEADEGVGRGPGGSALRGIERCH